MSSLSHSIARLKTHERGPADLSDTAAATLLLNATTHLDMYVRIKRKISVLALYDWGRKSDHNTQDLERFSLSKIIRNPPTVTNDVRHSVFIWWINQAINEFTMTLLAKTTFIVLIGCKGSDSLHMIPFLWEKQERSRLLSGGGWIISGVRPTKTSLIT